MHNIHTQHSIACTYRHIHTQARSGTHTEALEENQVFLNHMILGEAVYLKSVLQCAIFSLDSNPCSVSPVCACSITKATRAWLKHSGLGLPSVHHASQGFREAGIQ